MIVSFLLHRGDIYKNQATSRADPLHAILHDLEGVPHIGSDELKDARDTAITLELTNRFALVKGTSYTFINHNITDHIVII